MILGNDTMELRITVIIIISKSFKKNIDPETSFNTQVIENAWGFVEKKLKNERIE